MKRIATILMVMGLFAFGVSAVQAQGIVSFNKATAEELMAIEDVKIPEDLAKAIVKYREDNGAFELPEDLIKVPGMTVDFLEELNPQELDGDVVYDPDAPPALAPSKC